VTEEKI